MKICLLGPCSPKTVLDLLDPDDAQSTGENSGYGGALIGELARGLVAAGHEVTVVTLDQRESLYRGQGFSIHSVALHRRPREFLADQYAQERVRLADVVRNVNPDVVHAHWTYEYELAAQQAGGRHFTTAHDAPWAIVFASPDGYRIGRLAVALNARRGIRHLSCGSERLAGAWRQGMLYRREIAVLPVPVPRAAVPDARVPSPIPTVLDVSSSARHKNVTGLLKAFRHVRSAVPEARLRLVGPGLSEYDPPAEWARRQGLAQAVTFLGELPPDRVRLEYGKAWVMAHASVEEGFGLSVAEALLAGLPVVAGPRVGPFPGVLRGGAGAVTDTRQPGVFAEDISRLLVDGVPRVPAGVLGQIRRDLETRTVVDRYLQWYDAWS